MKFLCTVAALIGSAIAQSSFIGAPAPGTNITPGTNLTVMVTRPDTLTGSTEVAIVLSLQHCSISPPGTCDNFDYSEDLGSTLYLGGFNPQFHSSARGAPPHQNFTVFVPPTIAQGAAVLTLTHLSLVGAGPFPLFETRNVTLNVL